MKVSDLLKDAPTHIADRELAISSSIITKTCNKAQWRYENRPVQLPDRKAYGKGKYAQADYDMDCLKAAQVAGEFLVYNDKTTSVSIRIK